MLQYFFIIYVKKRYAEKLRVMYHICTHNKQSKLNQMARVYL